MDLLREYPIFFRTILFAVILALIYFISGFIINLLKLKISRWQFSIFIYGVYLMVNLIMSWA
jgi:hypothetical protein